jgi:hypothetical protein
MTNDVDVMAASEDDVMIDEVVGIEDVDKIEVELTTELLDALLTVGTEEEEIPLKVIMGVKLENELLLLLTTGTDVDAGELVLVPPIIGS